MRKDAVDLADKERTERLRVPSRHVFFLARRLLSFHRPLSCLPRGLVVGPEAWSRFWVCKGKRAGKGRLRNVGEKEPPATTSSGPHRCITAFWTCVSSDMLKSQQSQLAPHRRTARAAPTTTRVAPSRPAWTRVRCSPGVMCQRTCMFPAVSRTHLSHAFAIDVVLARNR